MFRFAIRKGWVTGDKYQKEWGLAAQQALPRATSRVNLAFAAEFVFYGALVTVSPQVSPHCMPLNTDRTGIACSWSFLLKREQLWIQHSGLPTLLHIRACILHPANLWHSLLTVRFWALGLPLSVVSHTLHQILHCCSSPRHFSLTEAQLFGDAPNSYNSHKWSWHNCHGLA